MSRLAGVAERTGDLFVLHPKDRPDECLTLTGQDLLRLKGMVDGFAQATVGDELAGAAETISSRLGGYFAGLR